ncbi:hypothetical protein [Microbacterium sp.]|uniref:hypothetical protein n=1 Tax=Microbacterium sp. TaxID=51671 RepID=UPI002810D460|nr:hypothetical protein [Microbacterium sp.]
MSSADRPDDSLYSACITWDVPHIRRAGNADALEFVRTVQLRPGSLDVAHKFDDESRTSPMRRAVHGLRLELSGELLEARKQYGRVARQPGVRGLLGLLLIAWMPDAAESDFERVEKRLEALRDSFVDVVAVSYAKLALWSFDSGNSARSRRYFTASREIASGEYLARLDEIAHWFGFDRVVHFGSPRTDISVMPWIQDFADSAARQAVEEEFKRSVKNPWRRSWTFGGRGPLTEMQAAEMQASWAGAAWLMPQLLRQSAALTLGAASTSREFASGLADWVRGGGSDIADVANSVEGELDSAAIDEIFFHSLRGGANVRDPRSWLHLLHALWSEVPAAIVDAYVAEYSGPERDVAIHDESGLRLALYAKFLVRSEAAAQALWSWPPQGVSVLARALPVGLASRVDRQTARLLVESAISTGADLNKDWQSAGWSTLARLAESVGDQELIGEVISRVPDSDLSAVSTVFGAFVPVSRLEKVFNASVRRLRNDIEESRRGRFTGWAGSAAYDVARIIAFSEVKDERGLAVLREVADNPNSSFEQMESALRALLFLTKRGLVPQELTHGIVVGPAPFNAMADDAPADQRLLRVLRVHIDTLVHAGLHGHEALLLGASRDNSAPVRLSAIEAISNLSLSGVASSSLDAALLGALYDPAPKIQAAAVKSVVSGSFVSESLRAVAIERLVELWPLAGLEMRTTLAGVVAERERLVAPGLLSITKSARRDRSVIVQWAAGDAQA